jgi:diaminohydroxyphosphoribosylaminopyrimidine deaminase/5-amino-6-(5-phosphoribosylamino)uracil reductase
VLDTSLRTPDNGALVENEPQDVVVFCLEGASAERRRELEARGVTIVEVGDDGRRQCDLRQVLRWLGTHRVTSVLVEGGGEVHWSFLKEGLAHSVRAYVAPIILGGREATPSVGGPGFPSPQEAVKLRFVEVRRLEGDLVLSAEVEGV